MYNFYIGSTHYTTVLKKIILGFKFQQISDLSASFSKSTKATKKLYLHFLFFVQNLKQKRYVLTVFRIFCSNVHTFEITSFWYHSCLLRYGLQNLKKIGMFWAQKLAMKNTQSPRPRLLIKMHQPSTLMCSYVPLCICVRVFVFVCHKLYLPHVGVF